MRPEQNSRRLLSVTRSKAKMYEYNVALEHHIEVTSDPAQLLPLAVGLLGDLAAQINSSTVEEIDTSEEEDILRFSAQFFDAYLNSRLNTQITPYILLLGAASYYLCNLPGSSIVLTRLLRDSNLNLAAFGLEELLFLILRVSDAPNSIEFSLINQTNVFGPVIQETAIAFLSYYRNGRGENELFEKLVGLRDFVYRDGTSRQLLFVDIVCALIRKRHQNSKWSCLPKYSNINVDAWRSILEKSSFIHELWPAQHLLGEAGVFAGNSAIVQMPTSAGKTKSIEIIIRSAFLSRRASTAIVVVPFRTLCHEISANLASAFIGENVYIDEFSDVFQVDFQAEEISSGQQIWIVTPEKLLYILRQLPTLAEKIGLLIYDEGHQFDNDSRGVTYELLLTSLKSLIKVRVQTVLISAVISNAEEVKQWLVSDAQVIKGENLTPTFRTVAFATWLGQLGRLDFVTPSDPNQNDFFVPRILEQHELEKKGRETKERVFPVREESREIALYLGLKLTPNGSVAIFCGTKVSVVKCAKQIVDVYERNLSIAKPVEYSNQNEVRKLVHLHAVNLGAQASSTQSAELGVFTHHNNVPHGIRLAVEYALKENLIRFVVCTSTLAQGVNMPIRYLILSNFYQAGERIKVRDFHNLIGRAGRSGMHTEGSIIFADPTLFVAKDPKDAKNWRWQQVTKLLRPENSEPCLSTLLSLFEPLKSDKGDFVLNVDILELVRLYISGEEWIEKVIQENVSGKVVTASPLRNQLFQKIKIIETIESYLLTYWDNTEFEDQENSLSALVRGTFAYFLADEEEKSNLIECFTLLSENIQRRIPQVVKRKVFGRTLYGMETAIGIENWVNENIEVLIGCNTQEELVLALWSLFKSHISNSNFKKCEPKDFLISATQFWIEGKSFYSIFEILEASETRITTEKRKHKISIEQVVDICENALAYEGGLLLSAVIEMIGLIENTEVDYLIRHLQALQKRIKYGLSSQGAIALYEIGFADRMIASELNQVMNLASFRKPEIISALQSQHDYIVNILSIYPSYFSKQLEELLK